MKQRTYIAIDLKSFYASVECRERGLDPLDTNLVVATRVGRTRPSALRSRPLSRAMGFPGAGDCLRLSSALRKRMPDGSTTRRGIGWKDRRTSSPCYKRTRLLR